MTLSTAGKDWLAINAGVSNCFSPSGVSFVDADEFPFTGGTKDVIITFIGANMVGKQNAIIIAGTSYNGFVAINGSGLTYADATFANNSDGHPGATLPQYCVPTPHVISATLTVDKTDCAAPCTVGGTVSWTNSGDAPSAQMDLQVTVNGGTPTTVATGLVINPGETTPVYEFSLPDLPVGTYEICALPDSGTTCKIVTVTAPANIVATSITLVPDVTTCLAPCSFTEVNITWTNNGGTSADFTPTMILDGTPTSSALEPLGAGLSITRSWTASNLLAGSHTICADPNPMAFECKTITVNASASFTSTPSGSLVYIDDSDTSAGTTPVTVPNLPVGTHQYRLTNAECYSETTGEFVIAVGANTVDVPITFDTAARFESTPAHARIWIDGVDTGIDTPGNITGLTVGDHMYKLKKPGYLDVEGPFTTILCQRINIPANLSQLEEAGMGGFMMAGLLFGALLFGTKKEEKKKKGLSKVEGLTVKQY